jgi:hypothetical protein
VTRDDGSVADDPGITRPRAAGAGGVDDTTPPPARGDRA